MGFCVRRWSWSKRSYATKDFSVLSGQALSIYLRNKFCSICIRASTQNEKCKKHKCCRNWDESAAVMQAEVERNIRIINQKTGMYESWIEKLPKTSIQNQCKTINLNAQKLWAKFKILALINRSKCVIYEHGKCEIKNTDLLEKNLENDLHQVFGNRATWENVEPRINKP